MPEDLAELRARCERLELLWQVSQVIHSTLEPQEALELILREAARLTRASSGSVVLVNPTSGLLEIQASWGLPPEAASLRLRVGEGITGGVALTGQPARVGRVTADRRYVMIRPNVQSELAVPLHVAGTLRGVLNVDSDRPDAFSAEDQALLEGLALQAAMVIRNTWLYEQVRLKARLLEALVSVGQAIASTLNLDDALQTITREACGLMNARVCSLLMLDASGEWLDLRACHGGGPAYLAKPRLSVAESLVGSVVRRRRPMQVQNVQTSSRYQSVETARAEGLVSLLSVPLVFRGQPVGALNVYTGAAYSFSNEEIRILSALADLSATALERARLYERVVDVEEQLRRGEKLAVLGLLAAEVAHEVRNPLTVMKMLFHSLDLQFPPGDPRARDAQIMGEKIEHLNRIVERTLDLARHTEPKLAAVDLNRLIDDLGLLIRHKLTQQRVRLVRRLDPALPSLQADATQLEQAFLNLALNAVEAMPEGGQLTVATRSWPPATRGAAPTHVVAVFRDTGHGMTPEQKRRAFSSLLDSTKAKGAGLGLALVARVVDAHHGKLQVASQPGRGTTFTLLLPIEPEPALGMKRSGARPPP